MKSPLLLGPIIYTEVYLLQMREIWLQKHNFCAMHETKENFCSSHA